MKPHYKTLGVKESATQDEIKKAYRTLSKENHPDKEGEGDKQAEINVAYSVLGDSEKRKIYDATGQDSSVDSIQKQVDNLLQSLFIRMLDMRERVGCDDFFRTSQNAVKNTIEELEQNKDQEIRRNELVKRNIESLNVFKDAKAESGMTHLINAIDAKIKQEEGKLSEKVIQEIEMQIVVHKNAYDILLNDYPAEEEDESEVFKRLADKLGQSTHSNFRPFDPWRTDRKGGPYGF